MGCNRRLPAGRSGCCPHCHRGYNRSDRSSFRHEPLDESGPSVLERALWPVAATVIYSSAWWLDGWVGSAIWLTENQWPIASLLIIWLRSVLVIGCVLYPLSHTAWDRLIVYWTLGCVLGALLALPYGSFATLPGVFAGMAAAFWLRWVSLGGGWQPAMR